MTDTLFDEILSRLDVVVLERMPGGSFVRLGSAPPPAWFERVFLDAQSRDVAVVDALPFLDHFITDAETVWRDESGARLRSDVFMASDANGSEVPLVASAVVAANRCLLIMEVPAEFEDRRRALQSSRDQALAHEAHLSRTRTLLKSVDAAQRMARQLARSGLGRDQQELAAGIIEQLNRLTDAIEELAPVPKGVTQPRR